MITKNDLKFLNLAKTISTYSDYPGVKIGACVVHKNSIVSTGCNKNKSHPEQLRFNRLMPYEVFQNRLHAEMDALIRAGNESKNATLYVFRQSLGIYRNCKPCKACMGKIKESGIKRVVYTTENGIKELGVQNAV